MKIHQQKILHAMKAAKGNLVEFRFAKFGQEDRVFGDLSLDVGSD